MRQGRVFLVAAAILMGCSRKTTQATQAPDFTLKDLSGKNVTLSSFKGRPVLLDFWATWCGPCRMSIPYVQAFYQKHQAEGLVVLGVNMDEDPSQVPEFVKYLKMTYPVLLAAGTSVPQDYGVEGIPSFVIINQEGRVVRRYQGFGQSMLLQWESDLQGILASNPH